MVARVMPDAEYLRECVLYDAASGILTWKVRPRSQFRSDRAWRTTNSTWAGKQFGTIITMRGGIQYIRGGIDHQDILAHRLIWKWMTGQEPQNEVDHRDGDGLNNRWLNLREGTHQQNQCNTKNRVGTKAPRGVYRHVNRWVAVVNFMNEKHYLGTFATAEDAHQAYLDANQRLHAEYSFTNRPETADETL